jgi:hypothetical protein
LSRAVRAPLRWRHSIKLRLLALFVVLALALSYVVVRGAQSAFAMGWREAGRPLLSDYIDRLAAEVAPAGTPDLARAQALTARLPIITLAIDGRAVRWRSHAADGPPAHALGGPGAPSADGDDAHAWRQLVQRTTRDGHRLRFGLDEAVLERRPRMLGAVLGTVLLLMVLAYLVVRRLLRPLDAIQAGVRRFGAAALDLAWVAAGRFDGFWEAGLSEWDVAAGILLVKEAGGFVCDYRGGDQMVTRAEIVAGNAQVQSKLHKIVSGALRN